MIKQPPYTHELFICDGELYMKGGLDDIYIMAVKDMKGDDWKETRTLAAAPALLRMLDTIVADGCTPENINRAHDLIMWATGTHPIGE